MTVFVDCTGELAFVTIDNPPINAASHAVRAGLIAAIAQTEANENVRAVVLRAAGRTFTAGADVAEFNQPPVEPHLPDVILAMEQATKPWVAALHGTVLGGGLEIALGCVARVAKTGTNLGLPEVNLGLIPGAGGTVRLPRLVDPAEALTLISSGKPITADKALRIGLVDRIAEADASEDAITLAKSLMDRPKAAPLSARDAIAITDLKVWDAKKAAVIAKARGNIAPKAAVEAVQSAMDLPATEALAQERTTFMSLKSGPQSAALSYIFFAERAAGKIPAIKGTPLPQITKVGVIGGGTMGAGIAAACLLAGLDVTMIERDTAAADAVRERVFDTLSNSLKRKLITLAQKNAMQTAFKATDGYGHLADADLIIEAVFEDMDVKKEVFRALDAVAKPGAVLATNTSYLDIGEIAAVLNTPSRAIGLHFFSPAHIMKLLELVIPEGASSEAIAMGAALGKRLGKITVPAGVCDGFIGNRIMSAYRRVCDYLLEDGALPQQIDAAMRNYGFPMGIYEMQDMAGLDIAWAMRKRRAATRPVSGRYVDVADQLCEQGRFGRKTGRGWYLYDGKKAVTDPEVETLIISASKKKEITRRDMSEVEIMNTILLIMQAEGQAVLDEGVAAKASDIDVVMVNGYGFPRWRGGPMFVATQAD